MNPTWWMCLSLAALPLVARAQGGPPTPVQSQIAGVARLYNDLEYERALSELVKAKRMARTQEEHATLLLYEGILLSELGREDEAKAAFNGALVTRPDASLPLIVSPKIQQRFEQLRQEVQHEGESVAKSIAEPHPLQASPPAPPSSPKEQAGSVAEASLGMPPAAVGESRQKTSSIPKLVPAITGGAALVAGGIFWALAKNEQSRLQRDDPSLATREDVRHAASRGRTFQGVGFGLMGAGIVGLGIATSLFLMEEPEGVSSAVVGVSGTSAIIYGRWP